MGGRPAMSAPDEARDARTFLISVAAELAGMQLQRDAI